MTNEPTGEQSRELSASARAEAQRILDAEARRLLAEQLARARKGGA